MSKKIIPAAPGYKVAWLGDEPVYSSVLSWLVTIDSMSNQVTTYAITTFGHVVICPATAILTPDGKIETHEWRNFNSWEEWRDWARGD